MVPEQFQLGSNPSSEKEEEGNYLHNVTQITQCGRNKDGGDHVMLYMGTLCSLTSFWTTRSIENEDQAEVSILISKKINLYT